MIFLQNIQRTKKKKVNRYDLDKKRNRKEKYQRNTCKKRQVTNSLL